LDKTNYVRVLTVFWEGSKERGFKVEAENCMEVTEKDDRLEVGEKLRKLNETIINSEKMQHTPPVKQATQTIREEFPSQGVESPKCNFCGSPMKYSQNKNKWYCGALCWKKQ
jgi:hypothetical protein